MKRRSMHDPIEANRDTLIQRPADEQSRGLWVRVFRYLFQVAEECTLSEFAPFDEKRDVLLDRLAGQDYELSVAFDCVPAQQQSVILRAAF